MQVNSWSSCQASRLSRQWHSQIVTLGEEKTILSDNSDDMEASDDSDAIVTIVTL